MGHVALAPMVIVHGGAGTFSDERVPAARAGCRRAAGVGLQSLSRGATVLDAVCAAVRVLENDPTFNAGVGAVLTRARTVEMDAAVMRGCDLAFGAVAAMPAVKNPIDVARHVLLDGEHSLLCGAGAWEVARAHGIYPTPLSQLIVPFRERGLDEEAERRMAGAPAGQGADMGTVGACAVDAAGNTAVATSTGGMTYKRVGRIGDTPLPGCGSYADDTAGAASATGDGEAILRVTMARHCIDGMRAGKSASDAAWASSGELSRVGGTAGIICVDRYGRAGAAHCSERMAWAVGRIESGGGVRVADGVRIEPAADIMDMLARAPVGVLDS